jgi:hypothetical protein
MTRLVKAVRTPASEDTNILISPATHVQWQIIIEAHGTIQSWRRTKFWRTKPFRSGRLFNLKQTGRGGIVPPQRELCANLGRSLTEHLRKSQQSERGINLDEVSLLQPTVGHLNKVLCRDFQVLGRHRLSGTSFLGKLQGKHPGQTADCFPYALEIVRVLEIRKAVLGK